MADPRPLNPEDVLAQRSVDDAQVTPDGREVAFVVTEPAEADDRQPTSRIWLATRDGRPARPFTGGPHSDKAPRWSPDGHSIAFLSDRAEQKRFGIYLLDRAGGEARALTSVRGTVDDLAWMPDGRSLAFQMDDPEPEEEKKRREAKDDPILFEARPRYGRIWVVALNGGEARQVTTGDLQVWQFALSPDGAAAAAIVSDAPYEWSWYQARLAIVNIESGQTRTILTTQRQLANPVWSPDGRQLAVISCTWSDRGLGGGDVLLVSAADDETRNLTEGAPASITGIAWPAKAPAPLAVGYAEGKIALWDVDPSGGLRLCWSAEACFVPRAQPHCSVSADGRVLAVAREDPKTPAQIWSAERADGGLTWQCLTAVHEQPAFALGAVRTLHWHGTDGTLIQGLLIEPLGYEAGRRYPLVVLVHGGPSGIWAYNYLNPAWAQLLAGRGVAVLLPNPRGSTGWGTAFAEANLGDMGGADLQDILAGVDHCVEAGLADPEQLGIGGWSYGGFITAWAITQTDRFAAAVMGAGIANWRSFHGVSDIPTWDRLFYEADPYEVGGRYDRFSPLTHVARVRTPLLIVHGEQDVSVPVGQAHEYFRALKERNMPVELVIYPREGHGIKERAHLRDMLDRYSEWFVRHLGGTPAEAQRAVPDPLPTGATGSHSNG
ncbi:MAG TPA: S9 family peptidase [Chloroflexota bacterium]|nr:S9 family peptidase [Chloroflexota bacterium]